MQHSTRIKLVLILAASFFSYSSQANSGDPDQSFGREGRVLTDFFGGTDVIKNLSINDGKILVSGSATKYSISDHFALARYTSDGSLDQGFGKEGIVTTKNIAANKSVEGDIAGVGVQSDGKIIVCGRGNFGGALGIVVLRYTSDGFIDRSFGEDGAVFTPEFGETNYPLELTLDQQGKIVIVAASFVEGENSSFAVFRFNGDGTLDESFGVHGSVRTKVAFGNDVPRAVKIDEDGDIVVGGFSGNNKYVVVRYNSNGTLDINFGNAGVASIFFNDDGVDTLHALVIQKNGEIVVGGDVQVGSFAGLRMVDFGLARLTREGQLDSSFNQNGRQITYFVQPAASTLWALALQADGKIVAVGDASIVNGLGVARYESDGSLDESFGEGGKKVISFGRTCHWEAVGLQADGKIVAGGYVWSGKQYDVALVRIDN